MKVLATTSSYNIQLQHPATTSFMDNLNPLSLICHFIVSHLDIINAMFALKRRTIELGAKAAAEAAREARRAVRKAIVVIV